MKKSSLVSVALILALLIAFLQPMQAVAAGSTEKYISEIKLGVGKKYRGNYKDILVSYINDRLSEEGIQIVRKRVFITHTCVDHPEYVAACVEATKATGLFDDVFDTAAGATIASHCGPNTLGILFEAVK